MVRSEGGRDEGLSQNVSSISVVSLFSHFWHRLRTHKNIMALDGEQRAAESLSPFLTAAHLLAQREEEVLERCPCQSSRLSAFCSSP